MLGLYKTVSKHSENYLRAFLQKRLQRGKEDSLRIGERQGIYSKPRPEGQLLWVHGASVGEAQSALILIKKILEQIPSQKFHVMITTGTTSSARFLESRLPQRCFHQFYPLDHPDWVARFLDHWKPDAAIWMESELWPNMLDALKSRGVPAAMVNARLSDTSFKRWQWIKGDVKKLLGAFRLVLTQNEEAAERYTKLGASNVHATGNIKYSAKALSYDEKALQALRVAIGQRPVWVYASTHKGEEAIACRVHQILKTALDDVLTIIIPRHPERGDDIEAEIQSYELSCTRRSKGVPSPSENDDIYLADTMGELGLFYRLAPIACIGRSLSDDGGGGHNPVEAAQLHCAALHGPNVQFQKDFFHDLSAADAALQVNDEAHLAQILLQLFAEPHTLQALQDRSYKFVQTKSAVVDDVLRNLASFIQDLAQP